jgi:type IV pilus assembly protein PilQ
VDIDVHRVEVRWLLQRLATLTETNLVLFDDVQGTVTVQMSRVPPGAALERVARAVGLVVERSGSMVLVRAARSPE